jgi:sugar phosphate isomerase/epimerase
MRLGASTLGFRHDTMDMALKAISAAGFVYVDLAVISSYCPQFDVMNGNEAEIAALGHKLVGLGLTPVTLNAGEGLLGDPATEARAIDGANKALAMAKALGCYAVTLQSGPEPDATRSWETIAKRVTPQFAALCDRAADLGLDIAVEIHKDLLVFNTETALDLADRVNHPAFGYTVDPSHMTHAGERTETAIHHLGALVRHVHLRDAVGTDIMVVPGDGEVDFAAIATALRKIGYARTCTLELEYEHARAPEVIPDLVRARDLLQQFYAFP